MKNKNGSDGREAAIQEFLLAHPEGLTVQDLAKKLEISTVTMAKELDVLLAKNKIYRRTICSAKIHYHLEWIKNFPKD